MTALPGDPPRATDPLAGGGEMGALMRSIDWSQTAVGASEGWPQSLRTALSILLETGFPMYIAWGPEFTQFYNDGYRPILGSTKHPAAMGRSTRETFAEIWHIIGPMFEGVMEGTPTTVVDFLLPLDRHGFVEECYFIFSYSPIREEGGRVGGVLVTVTETTQRVLAARRLQTLQALAARTEGAPDAEAASSRAAEALAESPADLPFALVYLLDGAPGGDGGRATLAGAAGVAPGGAGSPLAIDLAGGRLDGGSAAGSPPGLAAAIARVAATGAPALVETLPPGLALLDGRSAPSRALALPVARPGEGPAGVLIAGLSPSLVLDDEYRSFLALVAGQVAAAVARARALAEARARAEALAELDRAKTAFFSNVSHELRTPLTLLLGPAEEALAEAEALSPADTERWRLVHRNAVRLQKLVNTLLDFSRLEAGRAEASYEPVDLPALTRDLASVFRSAVERAGLALRIDAEPLGEPVYVDRDMWEKIVSNLLSNALKFTFEGEIEVSLRRQGGEAVLAVRDTGTGIPAAELPRLFERFHRVPGARSRTHEGTGIGLALVQELARLHGGRVAVESAAGRGSTFTVALPLGSAHLPAERIGAARTLPPTGAAAAAFVEEALRWSPEPAPAGGPSGDPQTGAPAGPGAAPRVLLADDNADMREYVARLLAGRFAVEAVADGETALARALAEPPDLVLSDVMMPGLGGRELTAALRADPRTREVPVVLLSARAGEEARVEGLAAGADDYLAKPFSARELLARVATHVELSRLRRRLLASERAARAGAEMANRAKDEFLAMLGHELRNPLAPIVSALELMRLRDEGAAARERAVIERQVAHLIRLVDDLLDVSRITRGKVDLQRERLEIARAVAEAVEMAGPLVEQRRHRLAVDVPAAGLAVWGDRARLAQVVANLLTNAARYTPPGGAIEVAGWAEEGEVVVAVRDSGIGLSAEMLPKVFDLFAQERQPIDRAQGGLGLGLAIVRSLVELHGGSVAAASAGRGSGSEFIVRLPAAPPLPLEGPPD